MSLFLIFIVSGCATESKKSQLLSLQQKRIQNLEKQLELDKKLIGKMKREQWVNRPIVKDESLALRPLKLLIKKNKWGEALHLSSQLKDQYPKSVRLRIYRHNIFKKMGLTQQAENEKNMARNILTSRKNTGKLNKNVFK